LILEAAFLGLIFFPNLLSRLLSVAGHAGLRIDLSALVPAGTESIEYRALWALFLLTGLLSSFPGFKDIDNWLLRSLHRAALIPDEARVLAETLYEAPFLAPPATIAVAKSNLTMRDVIAVANGKLKGRLEQRIIDTLCLRNGLQLQMTSARHTRFKIKLQRDLQEIAKQNEGLAAELKAYLRDQERLFARLAPEGISDIDEFMANADNSEVTELSERRRLLQIKCDSLYETTCLLTALFVFATGARPEGITRTLEQMGFSVNVPAIPPLDWDAVARVISSTFLIMVSLNGAYAVFARLLGWGSIFAGDADAARAQVIRLALLFTVVYSTVMLIAIRLKRKWRRADEAHTHRPENLIIAVTAYVVTLLGFSLPFSYWVRHEISYAPLIFALNQGILGYFVGHYVDHLLNEHRISFIAAVWQGLLQFVVTLVAMLTAPPPFLAHSPALLQGAIFTAAQSALSGFLIGVLFQYFYIPNRRSSEAGSEISIRSTLKTA
jgi:hypothetical protein